MCCAVDEEVDVSKKGVPLSPEHKAAISRGVSHAWSGKREVDGRRVVQLVPVAEDGGNTYALAYLRADGSIGMTMVRTLLSSSEEELRP
jgi:hypothetical protein